MVALSHPPALSHPGRPTMEAEQLMAALEPLQQQITDAQLLNPGAAVVDLNNMPVIKKAVIKGKCIAIMIITSTDVMTSPVIKVSRSG